MLSACAAAQDIEFNSLRWEGAAKARIEQHLGQASLAFTGTATVKDVEFEDGIIDVDVACQPSTFFLGVKFRIHDGADENYYVRCSRSGLPDSVQYMADFGKNGTWQLFHGEGYTAAANLPLNQWFHLKVVVSGLEARLFVDNLEKPVLVTKDLKQGYSKGGIALWTGFSGGHFANFHFTPAPPKSHPPLPAFVAPANIVANWELSPAYDAAPPAKEVRDQEVYPAQETKWQGVSVEAPGMVVIDRYRSVPGVVPVFEGAMRTQNQEGKRVVYARAIVYSDASRLARMNLGYSDEVTVFINRQPVFTGKSAFRYRDPGFEGLIGVENDAVFLPLKKGRNEVLLGVSEYFGGWAFICRFADMNGLRFDTK